jgi:hypothetical protein
MFRRNAMSHSEVMKWFEYYFPDYAGERIDVFFPNGRNSIRIRQIYIHLPQSKRMEIRNDYQFFEWNEGRKKVKCVRL